MSERFRRMLVSMALLPALAAAQSPSFSPREGDCAIFREGGGGRVLKEPTYWLKGRVVKVVAETRYAKPCPSLGKPMSAFTPADWAAFMSDWPCVERQNEAREVDLVRVRLSAEDWETPWSTAHGRAGWLFRGMFLGTPLARGVPLDLDAGWLSACD